DRVLVPVEISENRISEPGRSNCLIVVRVSPHNGTVCILANGRIPYVMRPQERLRQITDATTTENGRSINGLLPSLLPPAKLIVILYRLPQLVCVVARLFAHLIDDFPRVPTLAIQTSELIVRPKTLGTAPLVGEPIPAQFIRIVMISGRNGVVERCQAGFGSSWKVLVSRAGRRGGVLPRLACRLAYRGLEYEKLGFGRGGNGFMSVLPRLQLGSPCGVRGSLGIRSMRGGVLCGAHGACHRLARHVPRVTSGGGRLVRRRCRPCGVGGRRFGCLGVVAGFLGRLRGLGRVALRAVGPLGRLSGGLARDRSRLRGTCRFLVRRRGYFGRPRDRRAERADVRRVVVLKPCCLVLGDRSELAQRVGVAFERHLCRRPSVRTPLREEGRRRHPVVLPDGHCTVDVQELVHRLGRPGFERGL